MPKQKNHPVAALALALNQAEPSRIQIFPAGEFDAPDGAMLGAGPWHMDAAAASALIGQVGKRKNDLPVYYEHADLTAAQNGGKAIAAGWLDRQSLEWVEGAGLFGTVAWTAAARAHIEAGEYRYLSPLFPYRKSDGRPVGLLSVAITNNPAIDGMRELAAASAAIIQSESLMDDICEKLIWFLQIPITSTPQEIIAELDKLKAQVLAEAAEDAAEIAPAAASGLPAFLAARKNQLAALRAKKPDPAEYVPVAALSATQTELAALQAKWNAREVEDLIDPAESDGRLLPAQVEWARELGKSNLAALTAYLQTARPIAALGRMQTHGRTPPEDGKADAQGIAALATKYQTEQAALGIVVNDIDAVSHVTQGA